MKKLPPLQLPYYQFKTKKREKRFVWVKPWLGRRTNLGFYEMLEQELRLGDESEYKKFLRMQPQDSEKIRDLLKMI